jgi:hypothetical protein
MGIKKSAPVKFQQRKSVFVDKIFVQPDDTVSWEAHDSDLTIFVPDASTIFGSSERIFDVPKGKNIELKVVDNPASGEQRIYYYAIYHKGVKGFAQSNSEPVIIVQG